MGGGDDPNSVGGPRVDCDGIPGFHELLEALADPAHPSHAHLKEWAGDYDPATFDALPIKYALGRIANRRNATKARLAKKKHECRRTC
jgi:pRiA4b ORF-3-like protein